MFFTRAYHRSWPAYNVFHQFELDAGKPIEFDDYAALKLIYKEITHYGIDLVDWHRASADFKIRAGPERMEITPELVMGA